MQRPFLSTLLALLVSGGLLYWLLSGTSLDTIVNAVREVPPWRVGLALALLAVVQWFRGWRFAVLMSGTLRQPSLRLVRLTLHLMLFNFILPFKLGEASFPVLMRRAFGTDVGSSVGHLLVARAFDVLTVLGLMLIAAACLPGRLLPPPAVPLLLVLGLLVLASPAALVVLFGHLRSMAPSTAKIMQRLTEGAVNARSPHLLLALVAQSLVIWGGHVVVAWLVIRPVAPEISLAALAMANTSVHLAFALPVPSVAGLGPPQAAWTAALTLTGVTWSLAATTALLLHGVILLAVLVLGLAGLVPWPGERRQGEQGAPQRAGRVRPAPSQGKSSRSSRSG